MLSFLLILIAIINSTFGFDQTFIGCYKQKVLSPTITLGNVTLESCTEECGNKYYRYSLIKSDQSCMCGNFPGDAVNKTDPCIFDDASPLKNVLMNVFSTGNKVPGPPEDLQISNITNTSATIQWKEPESFVNIDAYNIKAVVLNTYSGFSTNNLEWMYSNDTFLATLITLEPATTYNITLQTLSLNGSGGLTHKVIQTEIGDPDNIPAEPTVVNRDGKTITIKMQPVSNNNGPVSSYRIVVADEDRISYEPEEIKSYSEAKNTGDSHYVAAEITPQDVSNPFVVGDGSYYGKYFNAPLDPNKNYKIRLGIVSRLNNVEKVIYSNLHNVHNGVLVLDVDTNPGDSTGVVVGLSVAIGLLTFLLIAGIIGFVILRNHVANRRQHFSDNQELTLQGPMIEVMIEVENNGYIHEEDRAPVNHYAHLKEKVRTIPSSHLKIEVTNLLGVGKFGRVNSGNLQESDTFVPVAVYSVPDKKMTPDAKKSMLKELDLLIKTGTHENIIKLIGTSETPQLVCVVLEYVSMNLKDLLLGSRDSLPGRFSNISESQVFNIAQDIVKGMMHLEQLKIVHKQLCARCIMISNGFTPKISGYGLAQFYSHNKIPDHTRWTALEAFREQPLNSKSDVWSFGCLFWEICVLGGTPYGNVPNNNEIPNKIIKGLRLPQMQYFSDDLYQLMLNCWQIDMDERPTFTQLFYGFQELKENCLIPHLSFDLYSNFQYEQFYPDMELAVRPVF